VQQGLVARRINPRNSREILLTLTPRGRAAYQSILKAGGAANQVMLAGLAPNERRRLGELLNLFTRRANELLAAERALGP
jgi:DNA-binding MarR family transcriptional regulator